MDQKPNPLAISYMAHWPAPAPGPRMVEVTAPGRRTGEDGRTECGDIMYQLDNGHVARRLCGECAHPDVDETDRGCSAVLERHER